VQQLKPNAFDADERNSRAAQYVRMSTDLQRYSTENQAATIAAYAALHNLTIVRTYTDEGRSGLQINGRQGLQDLIDDVQSVCILIPPLAHPTHRLTYISSAVAAETALRFCSKKSLRFLCGA
jgi:predicted site-specific integrase-resolvase